MGSSERFQGGFAPHWLTETPSAGLRGQRQALTHEVGTISLAMPDGRDVSPVGWIPLGCESLEQIWGGSSAQCLPKTAAAGSREWGPAKHPQSPSAGTLLRPWGCDFQ